MNMYPIIFAIFLFIACSPSDQNGKDPIAMLKSNNPLKQADGAYQITMNGTTNKQVAIQLLTSALSSHHSSLKCNAIDALGTFGGDASEAVEMLIKKLSDDDHRVRGNAALALGKIKSRLDITIPALIDFSERDKKVGWQGLMALGCIGNEAKVAIPYLKSCLEDSNKNIRIYAKDAILKISPDEMKSFETTITVDGKTTIVPSGLKREKELQLISAIRTENIEGISSLIAEGVNLDCVDDLGRPALLFAIEKSNIEMVKLLLQNGADPNVSYSGRTALEMAVVKGNFKIVDILKQYQNASNISAPAKVK